MIIRPLSVGSHRHLRGIFFRLARSHHETFPSAKVQCGRRKQETPAADPAAVAFGSPRSLHFHRAAGPWMQPGPVARGIIFRNPGIRNIPEHLDVPLPEPAAKHPVVYPEPFRRVVSQRELRRVLLHSEGMQGDRNPVAGAAAFAHRDLLPADVRAAQSARNKGYEESQMVEDERDVLLPEM